MFLNELYRAQAEKAGIIYVDVWEGFVDEGGKFAASGPDVDGQTRRLRQCLRATQHQQVPVDGEDGKPGGERHRQDQRRPCDVDAEDQAPAVSSVRQPAGERTDRQSCGCPRHIRRSHCQR